MKTDEKLIKLNEKFGKTTDFSRFILVNGQDLRTSKNYNREVDLKRIDEFVGELNNNSVRFIMPALVIDDPETGKLIVIDGQNRLSAINKWNETNEYGYQREFSYILVDRKSHVQTEKELMIDQNAKQKALKNLDYLKLHSSETCEGNTYECVRNYTKLADLCKKLAANLGGRYDGYISTVLAAAGIDTKEFRDGRFQYTKNCEDTINMLIELHEVVSNICQPLVAWRKNKAGLRVWARFIRLNLSKKNLDELNIIEELNLDHLCKYILERDVDGFELMNLVREIEDVRKYVIKSNELKLEED